MAPEDEDLRSTQAPQHPVPQLQGPFEESMMESLNEIDEGEQRTDSIARRKLLLQGERYERVCAGRWKQRPGEKFHPLWKLSAQLSFGIHLLARGLAKSEEEVMRILQSHVNDIDGFLERTTEDFDLAQSDVDERLRYLRLPLEHVDVFDQMLEDRAFRGSIVDGNEKIEHIVERTSEAMKDALKDVQKGIDATGALGKYLTDLKGTWIDRTRELDAVYVAMLGNVEGWTRAFVDLQLQGNRLAVSLVQLGGVTAEMGRRAGIASRKNLPPYKDPATENGPPMQRTIESPITKPQTPKMASPRSLETTTSNTPPNKPLPQAPDLMIPARQASRAKLAHEEKIRRRSRDVLKEQGKDKATSRQTERRPSMVDKVRSVTKLGSSQAHRSKTKSSRPSNSSSAAAAQTSSSSLLKSPTSPEPRTAAPSSLPPQANEPDVANAHPAQPKPATELPAELPHESLEKQDTPKKSGLHLYLGAKHKDKDHGSGKSTLKSLNIFRRSPHSLQTPVPSAHNQPSEARRPSSNSTGTTSSTVKESQSVDSQLSPQSAAPQRQSPNPGLPSPPDLMSPNAPRGGEPKSYTALPNVLATAQRAKTVKASLRVSVPPSGDADHERTPRAIPTRQPEPLHTPVKDVEQPLANPKTLSASGPSPKPAGINRGLGQTNSEVPITNITERPMSASSSAEDQDRTPTTGANPQLKVSSPISAETGEAGADPIDTPLTSATMRSFSDFCKLPPQLTSTTPPPIHADELEAGQPISTTLASSVNETTRAQPARVESNKAKSDQVTGGIEQADLRSPVAGSKRASGEKKLSNPKNLNLRLRKQDLQNQSQLLDLIASTPPQSPIHARTSSDASGKLNAGGVTASASRILAPPEEAPPPPAPGGRSMMTPDYAAASAFEGERKTKRGSAMSTGGWKKVFTGSGGSSSASSNGKGVVVGIAGSKEEDEEVQMSANLMSGERNDVLWYKGMGKDGLWVSGA